MKSIKVSLFFLVAMFFSSFSFGDKMMVTGNDRLEYYVFTESIEQTKESIFATFETIELTGKQLRTRSQYGVILSDCVKKYGMVYARANPSVKWEAIANWVITGDTIGDNLAQLFCELHNDSMKTKM